MNGNKKWPNITPKENRGVHNYNRYPFSMQKHAHDIEFRKNRIFNEMHDMEMGEIPWDEEIYNKMEALLDKLKDLLDAVLNSRDGKVSFLTGPQIKLAKETVLWAENERGQRMLTGQERKNNARSNSVRNGDLVR